VSLFTCPGNFVTIDYPDFLSQHDVVYLAPAPDGIDGLPIGNGDVGAVLWSPPDHLRLAINKIDLWDDGPPGPFNSWGEEDEEISTMLRAAGALTISHGLPSLDRLYLTDFAARLRLADAAIDLRAATPFSAITAQAFISEAAQVLVVRYQDQTEEPLPRRIEAARWGTRSLLHWYRRIRRHDPLPLQGTDVGADERHLWITQQLRQLHFAVAVLVAGPATPQRLHQRAGAFISAPVTDFAATVYVAVVTSEEADDPLATAITRVDRAAEAGADAIFAEHSTRWRRFWEASFVDLPPEQDYVENLWYLNSYFVASASRGRYPLNHINANFGWNRDIMPWAHYYHWNEQMHIYPLHATGHAELALPHLRWRRAMLPHAIDDAQRVHGRQGAFYCDVSNRQGYQAVYPGDSLSRNLTPGPQIALQFWQHYSYTRDEAFLRDDAYPVIREVTRFYLDTVEQREDGRYTFVGTQTYEGVVALRDTLTDLAHARRLFVVFLEAHDILQAGDEALRARCQEVLEHLADFVTLPVATESAVAPDSIMDLRPVVFKELQPGDPTMPMWFLGYKVAGAWTSRADQVADGTPVPEGMANPATGLWIFSSTNMAPIFPTGLIGLDQAGTPDFATAVNTVRALGYDSQGFCLWIIAKARLGLADLLAESLERWPQAFQIYPQGFTHWGLANHPDMEEDPRYLKNISVVDAPGETVAWPIAAVSIHMSIEALPLLQLAIDEMLLQSYSGTLRVFPAVTAGWAGRFRLHAVGRFIVSAERAEGTTRYVIIESKGGEPCRVANPWSGAPVALYEQSDGWAPATTLTGEIIDFPTIADHVYLLLPVGRDPASLTPITITGTANQGAKTLGTARLGFPKGI
jgi:alpha-L-fucosidase 2